MTQSSSSSSSVAHRNGNGNGNGASIPLKEVTEPDPTFERRSDGFLHRTIDVGEVRLHLAEARPVGKESSTTSPSEVQADVPLVIFLHGFPEFWWSWRHQLEALSRAGFWGVAPDMRGYNESDKPKGVSSYKVEKLAGDIAGLIRALGREKAIVVGHDWGAVVAWAFAQEHPDLLERLVILNVPHPHAMLSGLRTLRQLKKSWYIFFFQLPGIAERAIAKDDFNGLRRMFRKDRVSGEDIERYIDAMRIPGVLPAAIAYYRAAVRRGVVGRFPKTRTIDRPVLVIWGDKDRHLGKEMADPPKRLVPNARVVHLPDATHWVQIDAPERVNELLLEFIRERAG